MFPQTTHANYRKILRSAADSEVIIRTKAKEDSRRTMYYLSEDMIGPLCKYYMNILVDFGRLYAEVIDDRLPKEEILKLIVRLGANTGWDNRLKNIKG